jgi:succinate dehydrogenase / fumarate reductase membrane anchor subunit
MATAPLIEQPRSLRAPRRRGINWEKWGWIYMRVSGVVLVVLIFGHLFVNLFTGEGVRAIDWAFVAGKFASPFWIVWDLLLLWLALIHGANGMRTLVNDYSRGRLRLVLLLALGAATAVLLLLGTLVLTTFDPCLGDATTDALSELCAAQ